MVGWVTTHSSSVIGVTEHTKSIVGCCPFASLQHASQLLTHVPLADVDFGPTDSIVYNIQFDTVVTDPRRRFRTTDRESRSHPPLLLKDDVMRRQSNGCESPTYDHHANHEFIV